MQPVPPRGATEAEKVPASPGEENKGKPPTPAPDAETRMSGAGTGDNAATTSPGEENKGKPPVAPD